MAGSNFKLIVPLVVFYLLGQIDAKDENNIMIARIFFGATMGFLLIFNIFLLRKVKAVNNQKKFKVTEADLLPPNPLTNALKVSADASAQMEMTVVEYDVKKVMESLRKTVLQSVIVAGVHYNWGHMLPLVMVSVTSILGLIDDKIVRIYLLGQSESKHEDLKRPFKEQSPFADAFAAAKQGQQQESTPVHDKKAKKKN